MLLGHARGALNPSRARATEPRCGADVRRKEHLMDITRRRFLGATSGAAALTAMARQPPAAAQAGDDPLSVRSDFPAVAEYAFLNTAYIGLIARPVVEAGRAWLDARAHRPFEVGDMLNKTDEAR